jgi:hypothetical protein
MIGSSSSHHASAPHRAVRRRRWATTLRRPVTQTRNLPWLATTIPDTPQRGGRSVLVVRSKLLWAHSLSRQRHERMSRDQGGFNRSSQHLGRGGVDGQASGVDEGVDGTVADAVAGCAGASSRGGAGVLAGDRYGCHDGRRGCGGRGGIRGWVPVVSSPWGHADRRHARLGSLSLLQ